MRKLFKTDVIVNWRSYREIKPSNYIDVTSFWDIRGWTPFYKSSSHSINFTVKIIK